MESGAIHFLRKYALIDASYWKKDENKPLLSSFLRDPSAVWMMID
jgi:hypothetical protein